MECSDRHQILSKWKKLVSPKMKQIDLLYFLMWHNGKILSFISFWQYFLGLFEMHCCMWDESLNLFFFPIWIPSFPIFLKVHRFPTILFYHFNYISTDIIVSLFCLFIYSIGLFAYFCANTILFSLLYRVKGKGLTDTKKS